MLHRFKISLANNDNKALLAQEQPLANIDAALRALMSSFPDLQVRVEDNVKAWTALTYSVRNTASSFRTALVDEPSSTPLDVAASSLTSAGDELLCPRMGSTHQSLRAFNEGLRSLRLRQADAVATLRDREYYKKKLNALTSNSSRSDTVKVKISKNERKLEEISTDLDEKIQELETGLQKLESQKKAVVADSLRAFLHLQNICFDSSHALAPILSNMQAVADKNPLVSFGSPIDENSPRAVQDEMDEGLELAGDDDSEEDERYFSSKKSNMRR